MTVAFVLVVADGSKVGKAAFARICPLNLVDELITDEASDAGALEEIRETGVKVTIV